MFCTAHNNLIVRVVSKGYFIARIIKSNSDRVKAKEEKKKLKMEKKKK